MKGYLKRKRKRKNVNAHVPWITYVLERGVLDPAHPAILFFIWNMEWKLSIWILEIFRKKQNGTIAIRVTMMEKYVTVNIL